MKQAGQIVLTPFPYTDLSDAKLRPVLLLRQASVRFDLGFENRVALMATSATTRLSNNPRHRLCPPF